MFRLDLQSRVPIYQQLQDRVAELIMLGILRPGDALPSVRGVARDLGVNPNTVFKAYQELEHAGVIYSVGGKGSFVAANDELGGQLRSQAVDKLRQAAAGCKRSGVTADEALSAVKKTYAQEEN